VRLKREIVTLGVPGINPNEMAGRYVKPQDWNALITEPGVVVVDTRNDYEVGIGSFEGAVDPHTHSFSELPAWVAAQSAPGGVLAEKDGKKPKVAMFCTGGIRCEKSTAFMRTQGFDEVYHLEGGILKYLETVPEEQSRWRGECFVFDERVSVVHGLATGHYDLCRACRDPISEADKASKLYVPGVSCPGCHDKKTEEQKRGFIERQRQVDYANRRRQPHIGAKLAVPDKNACWAPCPSCIRFAAAPTPCAPGSRSRSAGSRTSCARSCSGTNPPRCWPPRPRVRSRCWCCLTAR
jgi:UPF0176 protein